MKKLLIILFFVSLNAYSQPPSYVASNSLIGWWPFNGNANDESGNSNNGNVNGANLATDRFGNSNSAYQFNGLSSYIDGSISGLTSLDETTLSIWILSEGDAGGQPYDLFFQLGNYGSHTFAYAYNYSGTNLDLHSNCFNNPYPSLNINHQWHHIVIVDGSSSASVYIDGVLYFTWNAQQGPGCYYGSNTFLIGGGADNQYTTGYLDDVGFWDRALTVCEIQDLYNAGNSSITSTDNQTACDTYTWIDGNTYTTSNNTATYTVTNAVGCDSTVTLDLTINNSTTSTDTQVACDSYTWIDGVTYTASNNSATFTSTNAAGCDNIATLDLTVTNSSGSTDVQTTCDTYTWIDGNTYTTSNNTATYTVTNAVGCDSTVTLDLTINNSTTSTDTQVACDSYTWIDGVTYTASNNSATFTSTNAAGCDNIATLDLTVTGNPIATITQNGNDLEVTIADTYSWNTGEITQTITPTANGWYWCIVTDVNGCIGDTASYEVTDMHTSIIETINTAKKLLMITDMLGQETPYRRNTPLFYIYDDGTVEKRIVIE